MVLSHFLHRLWVLRKRKVLKSILHCICKIFISPGNSSAPFWVKVTPKLHMHIPPKTFSDQLTFDSFHHGCLESPPSHPCGSGQPDFWHPNHKLPHLCSVTGGKPNFQPRTSCRKKGIKSKLPINYLWIGWCAPVNQNAQPNNKQFQVFIGTFVVLNWYKVGNHTSALEPFFRLFIMAK